MHWLAHKRFLHVPSVIWIKATHEYKYNRQHKKAHARHGSSCSGRFVVEHGEKTDDHLQGEDGATSVLRDVRAGTAIVGFVSGGGSSGCRGCCLFYCALYSCCCARCESDARSVCFASIFYDVITTASRCGNPCLHLQIFRSNCSLVSLSPNWYISILKLPSYKVEGQQGRPMRLLGCTTRIYTKKAVFFLGLRGQLNTENAQRRVGLLLGCLLSRDNFRMTTMSAVTVGQEARSPSLPSCRLVRLDLRLESSALTSDEVSAYTKRAAFK